MLFVLFSCCSKLELFIIFLTDDCHYISSNVSSEISWYKMISPYELFRLFSSHKHLTFILKQKCFPVFCRLVELNQSKELAFLNWPKSPVCLQQLKMRQLRLIKDSKQLFEDRPRIQEEQCANTKHHKTKLTQNKLTRDIRGQTKKNKRCTQDVQLQSNSKYILLGSIILM